MENKDRIDEFLQRKFAEDQPEQRIVFREEHWLQAQALIEADERRRRRGLLWWWLGGAVVLLLAGWFVFAGGGDKPEQLSRISAGQEQLEPQENEISKITTPQDDRASESENTGSDDDAVLKNFKNKSQKQARGSDKVGKNQTKAILPDENPESKNRLSDVPGVAMKTDTQAESAQQSEVDVFNPAQETGEMTIATADPELQKMDATTKVVDRLPLPEQMLKRNLPKLEPLDLEPPAQLPARLKNWRWQFGFAAGVGTALGHLENEKPGAGAGLSARLHRRGKAFSINAGLFWRYRPGSFTDSLLIGEEVLKYSFGYTLERVEQRLTGTHWLELPLSVQYHLRFVNFEAGLMPSLLVAVQGREARIREHSLAPDPVTTQDRLITLDNRYFAKLHLGAFAGASWHLTNHLEIGLRLHYQPGRIISVSDASSPSRHSLWTDFGVRYLFGK